MTPKLHSIIPYSPHRPTLALPVFSDSAGRRLVQEFSSATGKVSGWLEMEGFEKQSSYIRTSAQQLDTSQLVVAFVNKHGTPKVGSVKSLSNELRSLLSSESTSSGVKLQISELLHDEESSKLQTGKTAASIARMAGSRAVLGFAHSSAIALIWNDIQDNSALDDEQKSGALSSIEFLDLSWNGTAISAIDTSRVPAEWRELFDADDLVQRIRKMISDPIQEHAEVFVGTSPEKADGFRIDPSELKRMLYSTLGADFRIAEWQFIRLAGKLEAMGYENIGEVRDLIRDQDHGYLSHIATGNRQGLISRFEFSLLAALGEEFVAKYPVGGETWLKSYFRRTLDKFIAAGVPVGRSAVQRDLFSAKAE